MLSFIIILISIPTFPIRGQKASARAESKTARTKREREEMKDEYILGISDVYACPNPYCMHSPFLTETGLRKHLEKKLPTCVRTAADMDRQVSSWLLASKIAASNVTVTTETFEVYLTNAERHDRSSFDYSSDTGEIIEIPPRLRIYVDSSTYTVADIRQATANIIVTAIAPVVPAMHPGWIVVFKRKPQTMQQIGLTKGWALLR